MDLSESKIPWKWIIIGAAVLLVAIIIRCQTTPESAPQVKMPVVCIDCGYTGELAVGDTPGMEPWPRTCPKCGKESLYLVAGKCSFCGKPVPRKDPQADQFGIPDRCPWCKKPYLEHSLYRARPEEILGYRVCFLSWYNSLIMPRLRLARRSTAGRRRNP